MTPIEHAIANNWPLIKLSKPSDQGPSPGKRPLGQGWEQAASMTATDAQSWLDSGGNVGMRCGNGLLVVDCDGARPSNLPDTVTVNTGGGGLHLYYRVPTHTTISGSGNTARRIAPETDTRYERGQVVYPGSVHAETGAIYEFAPGLSPDDIAIAELPQWVIDAINTAKPAVTPTSPRQPAPDFPHEDRYIAAAVAKALTNIVNAPEGQRNEVLNREAYSLAGLPLEPREIEQAMLEAALVCGLPDQEARKTIASGMRAGAERPREAPQSRQRANNGTLVNDLPVDSVEPPAGPVGAIIDPHAVAAPAPRILADKYLADYHRDGTLRYWRGDWYEYDGRRYVVLDETLLRAKLSAVLRRWHYYDDNDKEKHVISSLKEGLLRDVIGQLRQPDRTMVLDRLEAPLWLTGRDQLPAEEFAALRNGLLHLPTRVLSPHDPAYFTFTALPFAYDPDAPSPECWIDFLLRTWPGDDGIECAQLLQEWFGYCLSRDMSHHKMIWIIGPQRGGKGVMSRILSALIGEENTCSPTLGSIGDKHGGQVLIDKRLAVVGDARMSKRADQAAIVERLLSMSGGDMQTFARKYLPDWTGRPAVKFTLLSNELPHLSDASGALLGRLLLLQTVQSYLGREDRGLESRIKRELPGIFNWALDGLDRLNKQGRFTEPSASRDIMQGFRAISAPITQFVADRCEMGHGCTVSRDTLYAEYVKWTEEEGLSHAMAKARFGQALKSAFPAIGDERKWVRNGPRNRSYTGIRLNFELSDLAY